MASSSPSTSTWATPIHGNYHGYYSKRPSVRDPRLALLPAPIFASARVLDVGCNEGWVTCEIVAVAQSWGAHKVVGVDIDESLIRSAWRRRRSVWSLQAPGHSTRERLSTRGASPRPSNQLAPELSPDYFPMSCEHEYGSQPIPPSDIRGRHSFPHNILFRTADWTSTSIPEDAERYNVIVAFSISKWIHLNGGDDALKAFFQRVYSVLEPGGKFVFEPQAWGTYGKAKRMDERLRDNAKKLQIRPEDFGAILAEIGFGPAQHFGITGEGGFRRPVDLIIGMQIWSDRHHEGVILHFDEAPESVLNYFCLLYRIEGAISYTDF